MIIDRQPLETVVAKNRRGGLRNDAIAPADTNSLVMGGLQSFVATLGNLIAIPTTTTFSLLNTALTH